MRTKTIVAMAVLASVTLVGCNNDNDNELEVDRVKDTPMTFVTSVNQPATRAGYEKGELPEEAIFGLTITTPSETDKRFTQMNKKMEYATDKWIEKVEATKLLWKSSETTVTYIAYVPYSAEAVNADADGTFKTDYPVTVPADQTTAATIKAADFLYTTGTATGSESTTGIPLAFKHTLSQFKITLAKGSELADGVTFTTVELTSCCALAATIDLANGILTPAAAGNSTITLLGNAGKTAFECILVPQTFTNTLVVTITDSDDKKYVYTSNETLPFASGKTYTLPLTVGRDKVIPGTITAAPWTETPGGDLETE